MTFDEWYKDGGFKYDPEAPEWIARAAWDAATKVEREACAKIADPAPRSLHFVCCWDRRKAIAAKIRERSNAALRGEPLAASPSRKHGSAPHGREGKET